MIVVSHPTGNRNVRAVLTALYKQDLLTAFQSTLVISASDHWPRFLPGRLHAEFERRRYELPRRLIKTHPGRELARLLATRLGLNECMRHETGRFCVDRVYHGLDGAVARALDCSMTRGVYAYEDGALATFSRAQELGITRIYDLPIAYWQTSRRLMTDEAERLPAWAATLGGGVADSTAKLARKTRELELADLVVVPSRFVADSLPDWAQTKRVVLAPFGSPKPMEEKQSTQSYELRARRAAAGAPLRVLFAGSMGQRKGLGDLMAAVRHLARRDVELVVMGSLQAERSFYDRECPGFSYESGRPHAQVLELMRSCDVFCLPSIVEGRALVMQEAMSQGLPLIITPNTGGQDLVENELIAGSDEPVATQVSGFASPPSPHYGCGSTGFLVPIRSPEKIAEAIAWYADHRQETIEMGQAAQAKAKTYTWERYGQTIVDALRCLLPA